MALTGQIFRAALGRWADRIDEAAPALNALDARLGDGDLGATLSKCAANVRAALPTMPDDHLGEAFKACAMACSKASGSSFGTLLAVAFLTSTKTLGEKKMLPWGEMSGLLGTVGQALSARGKATLGDKTVLDTIEAARIATDGLDDPVRQYERSSAAVEATIAAFRDKPNKVGRARMFADKSVGLDDPGMIAFRIMLGALRQ